MLKVLDISNWQKGIDVNVLSGVDAIICKATEDIDYVDPYCDGFYQAAKNRGLLRGFYHFAGNSDPIAEADFFIAHTENYFNDGIAVLDWEGNQSVEWVNKFVNRVHDRMGVWPVIYANPWRFNQGGVEANCGRWVASYPEVTSPTFEQASNWDYPSVDGTVVGWQFCSDGHVSGYAGNLDCSVFYIDANGWTAYANASEVPSYIPEPAQRSTDLGKVNVTYALEKSDGQWWNPVTNFNNDNSDGYAGAPYTLHKGFKATVDKGNIRYQIHEKGGKWTREAADGEVLEVNGTIDGIACYYMTPEGYKYQQAWYRSQTVTRKGYLAVCCDYGNSVSGYDAWAGAFNENLDRFQLAIAPSNPF